MSTPHGFWVEYSDNRVFDGVVTRHLVTHGDIVVIHGFHDSNHPFSDIARRLHLLKPGMRVLFYTWAGRKRLEATSIAAVPTLEGMEDAEHFDLLLKNAVGDRVEVRKNGQTWIFLDPCIAAARDWLRDRVSREASLTCSDGAGLDAAIRTPRFPGQNVDLEGYPESFDLMIQGVSNATSMTIFNGLSVPRADQENLLAYAHGAAIEFFGLNDRSNRKPTFAYDILRYFGPISRHPDSVFLMFGRATRRPQDYTTYNEDWLWQRYLYCAYLLTAGKNTRWKQHAGFRAVPNSGRAGGLDVYADALHDLGSPSGDSTVEDGCYRRAFEGGLVLVLPAEAPEPAKVRVDGPMFTLEGARVLAGPFTVAPGEGHVLLYRRPVPPPALIRQFDAEIDPLWRWGELREEFGAWHLHLDETRPGQEYEHDLALDLVRHRRPRGRLTLWYRSSDPGARLEIVVEVDDKEKKLRFAVIDSALRTGSKPPPPRRVQFRAVAPAVSQFARLRVVGGDKPMIADGRWHTLTMDLEAACCATGRYAFHRALFVRLLGCMDIRRLRLADRGYFKDRG